MLLICVSVIIDLIVCFYYKLFTPGLGFGIVYIIVKQKKNANFANQKIYQTFK